MQSPRTIAVVNDCASLAEILQYNLEWEGYRVRVYHNSGDALEALIEVPPDLVIMDGTNYPLSGIELFRQLRRHSNVPVIFLSAWADGIEKKLRGSKLKASDYIKCPFSLTDFLTRVKLVLERNAS